MSPDQVPIPTWPVLRELLTQDDRSAAWRHAASWTIDVLEDVLGPTWPERAIEQFNELPIPLILAGGHTLAFIQTVDLAMRLHLLRSVEGFGRARKELRGNRALGRALHFSFQATLCGLAQKRGWPVQLEPGDPPADLCFDAHGRRTTVETRVLGPSQEDRELNAAVERVTDRVRTKAMSHGVWTAGAISSLPSDDECAELEAWIEASADFVRSGGALPRYADGPFDIELVRREDAQGKRLTSPGGTSDLLSRLLATLKSKEEQMQVTDTEWLCVENYTGIFMFTEWGWSPMPRKLSLLEEVVHGAFAEPAIAGVVICSGVSHFNGTVNEEHAETKSGAIGMRYAIEPRRAREALVIPLRDGASGEPWRSLFNAEPDWLPWALTECGLPALEEILP